MEPSTADLVPKMTGFRLKSGHFGAEDLEARSPGGGQPTGILRILTTRPPGMGALLWPCRGPWRSNPLPKGLGLDPCGCQDGWSGPSSEWSEDPESCDSWCRQPRWVTT